MTFCHILCTRPVVPGFTWLVSCGYVVQASRSSRTFTTPSRTRWPRFASTTSTTRSVARDRSTSRTSSSGCTTPAASVAGRCRTTAWTSSSRSVHPRVHQHHVVDVTTVGPFIVNKRNMTGCLWCRWTWVGKCRLWSTQMYNWCVQTWHICLTPRCKTRLVNGGHGGHSVTFTKWINIFSEIAGLTATTVSSGWLLLINFSWFHRLRASASANLVLTEGVAGLKIFMNIYICQMSLCHWTTLFCGRNCLL